MQTTISTVPTTLTELIKAVEDKCIVSADTDSKHYRFFMSQQGDLCYFAPRRKRFGYHVSQNLFDFFIKFHAPKENTVKTQEEIDRAEYAKIAKFKWMAHSATFSNSFIKDCQNLPSYAEWIEGGKKSLYGLGITTGNAIEGRVISLNRIAKQYATTIEDFRKAIATRQHHFTTCRKPFAGYDMTLSTSNTEKGFYGYLSLEYKGCGNGYYYLLINDNNFIGYDID